MTKIKWPKTTKIEYVESIPAYTFFTGGVGNSIGLFYKSGSTLVFFGNEELEHNPNAWPNVLPSLKVKDYKKVEVEISIL